MKQVMTEIERQTKFLFGINDDVDVDKLVTVNVTNQSLEAALDQMVKGTDITYQISSSTSFSPRNRQSAQLTFPELSAISTAFRSSERPLLSGAPRSASAAVLTVPSRFRYPPPVSTRQLEVSYLGYETLEVNVGNRTSFDFTLQESSAEIEQVVVTALGIKRSEKAVPTMFSRSRPKTSRPSRMPTSSTR